MPPLASENDHTQADSSLLRAQLIDAVRSDVMSGRYPPGYRLVERDVAATYGVSRIPAREALQALKAEGFLEVRNTRGLVVRTWTERDVVELFAIRQALEGLACREAAENRTDSDVTALREAVDSCDTATVAGDSDLAHHANARFHLLLVSASHNRTLAEVMSPILHRIQWLVRQIPDPHSVSHDHHAIVDAIEERKPGRAEELAVQHAQRNRSTTLRALRERENHSAKPLTRSRKLAGVDD
jgi:DNA-binding GntR family transcriptional regulator